MNPTLMDVLIAGCLIVLSAFGVYLASRLVSAGWHRSKFQALTRWERQRSGKFKEEDHGNL